LFPDRGARLEAAFSPASLAAAMDEPSATP
jgi:hypothetical protein